MKKIVIEKPGSYDQLTVKEFPNPLPAKGEILIETRACGVNFADCCVRMGVYSSAKEYVGWPITPGFEVTGIVTQVGEGATRFSKGQRALAVTRFGGYTTHLIVPEEQVLPLPDSLTFEEGAAFPAVFLTAHYALFELAHAKPRDTVLVHSAAGDVGSALVQLAKLAGCRVIGVVGSTHKIESLKNLGIDAIIDKSRQDLWKEAEKLSPDGYDIILDANGIETLRYSYQHLRAGGKLVVYGFHTLFSKGRGTPSWFKIAWDYIRMPRFNPLFMTNANHSVLAFNLSYLFDRKDLLRNGLQQILGWIEEKKVLLPSITTYALDDVASAHRALESGQTFGKLVLLTSR
ncbi:MAG: medium chain dehydrogenase/reductase family protein [Parachlamydia sp.]|nr:medium chain dehydrogenase/reductase family protein [Parachlamydia sp.]